MSEPTTINFEMTPERYAKWLKLAQETIDTLMDELNDIYEVRAVLENTIKGVDKAINCTEVVLETPKKDLQ